MKTNLDFTGFSYEEEVMALAQFLGIEEQDEIDNITEESYDHYGLSVYSYDGEEYAVGNDEECDAAQIENIENYIEECILPEINESYRNYFDNEAFIRDAKLDGRGHCLSSYDGVENEIDIEDEWYYIYRIN